MSVVSPLPRGEIAPDDKTVIFNALAAKFAADQALRDAVLGAVSRGASVRELSAFSNLSTNTISRWKRENGSKA